MPELFDREFVISASGIRIASRFLDERKNENVLKVEFQIERNLKKDPSRANISIYNLTEENRALFQTFDTLIEIEAGYRDNVSQIFSGTIDFASSTLDGRDWVTTVQAGDGTKQFKEARVKTSLRGPVGIQRVIKSISRALGYKPGNLQQQLDLGPLPRPKPPAGSKAKVTKRFFPKGVTLSGKAETLFTKYVQAFGLQWSVQDGSYLLLGPKETIGTNIIVLRPDTGLIGSPQAGEKGFVNLRCLMQPELLPARQIRIEAANDVVNGDYRIERSVFKGDTWGSDWYVDVEASPL